LKKQKKEKRAWPWKNFQQEICTRKGKENIPYSTGFAFQIHMLRKLEKALLMSLALACPPQIRSLVDPHPLVSSYPPSKEMDSNLNLTKKKAT
jgi:hypothetical protein